MTLLKTKPIPIINETVQFNSSNGNDAELFSASNILLACGAEVSWGSRNEDGRKIDLIVSFDHPWYEKERLLLLVQVKSGDAYGKVIADGFILKAAAKKLAQRTSHDICLLWVDRQKDLIFWAYVHPNTSSQTQEYKIIHRVSPAMRFDIARCQARNLTVKVGGAGIIIAKSNKALKERREAALIKYRECKSKQIINPILGKVEFTRFGWRHMFRKGRSAKHKSASIDVIGQIDKILEDKPSHHYITEFELSTQSNFQYRKIEYVLHYNGVKYLDDIPNEVTVIARILEEIRWPLDWTKKTVLSQLVDRRVVLLNCYHKQ